MLFGLFLAIGCAGNKPVTQNETGISGQAVTPAEAINKAVNETPIVKTSPAEIVTPTGENATGRQSAAVIQNVTETPKIEEFTLEELAKYNGKNVKAYIAYQGKVYDVSNSSFWKTGIHKGHSAGTDLSGEMDKAPHGSEILKGFPVIGTLKTKQY